ncbi:MAG: FHA domain-containing protein, partial [Bacteroidaceae bacterium]|nr:FHA domain-containing protein [Bacteroidaceae bacterium]
MKKIYTIGREESCDIVIPDQTDVVSRLHATLRID